MNRLLNVFYFLVWVVLNLAGILFASVYMLGGLRGDGWNVLIGQDQQWNAILDGDPRETISARAWRSHLEGRRFARLKVRVIDRIFGPGHCKFAYMGEQAARRRAEERYRKITGEG